MQHFIDFVLPTGIEDTFNTFRLGLFYAKRLKVGDTVTLVENKDKCVIGTAEILTVITGTLSEMCEAHAKSNHAMLSCMSEQSERLTELLTKFYGPHIATPTKKTTVIYMRRTDGLPPESNHT